MFSQLRLKFKAKKFRKIILNSKKPVMLFDSDTDGATSFLQLKRKFKNLVGFPMPRDFNSQVYVLDLVTGADTVIIFDVPQLNQDFIEKLSLQKKLKNILWADHHPTNQKDIIKKYSIIHMNPLNYSKSDNRPSCYLAYLVSDMKENLDLLTIGSISDFFILKEIKDFYSYDQKLFNMIIKINETEKEKLFNFISKNRFDSKKVKIEREFWIRDLCYEKGIQKFKNFFDFLYKIEPQDDVKKAFKVIENMSLSDILMNINNPFDFPFKQVEEVLKDYKKIISKALKEKDEELVIVRVDSKIGFAKTLAEELCYKFKNWKVLCVAFKKTGKDSLRCSLRGNGVNVNNLIQKSLKGLEGSGGGHPYAVGVNIKEKDFNKFKVNLKNDYLR